MSIKILSTFVSRSKWTNHRIVARQQLKHLNYNKRAKENIFLKKNNFFPKIF